MKTIFFVVLFISSILFPWKVIAQKSGLDSLIKAADQLKDNSHKAQLLNAISRIYIDSDNIEVALLYAQNALILAGRLSDTTNIAEANLNLGKVYTQKKDQRALPCFENALSFYTLLNKPLEKASVLDGIGQFYEKQNNYKTALDYYDQGLAIREQLHNKPEATHSHLTIARIYQSTGYYEESRAHYFEASKYAQEIGDTAMLARNYLEISNSYDKQGDFKNAISYALKSKKLYEALGHKQGSASINFVLGVFNMQLGNYQESLDYQFKAADYFIEKKQDREIAMCYNQIGSVYNFLNDFHKADYYLNEALRLAKLKGGKKLIASCNDNLGINYESEGSLEKALAHYRTALDGFQAIKERYHSSKSLCNIGNIYIKQGKYASAIDTFRQALMLSRETMAKENLSRSYAGLGKAFHHLNNTDSAYYYLALFSDMKDSLLDDTRAKQLIAMQELYESERKDHEIVKLNFENKSKQSQIQFAEDRQRIAELNLNNELQQKALLSSENERNKQSLLLADNIRKQQADSITNLNAQQVLTSRLAFSERNKKYWAMSGGTGGIVLLSLFFYQLFRRRQAKSTIELNELKNRVLRTQLNPHFIFNALNSIRNYIQKYPGVADEYLTRFSNLMRQVLENSEEEKITLQEEIAMLDNYVRLESIRFPQGFDYEIMVDGAVDAANIMLPPLILQPMVENAIWHGLKPLQHRGKIIMRFTEHDGLLEITIEDNGIGLGSATLETTGSGKKRSMGMQITRERIDLISRKAKSKGWLKQQLFETGSRVEMGIPVA